jgi:hypothetical protein
MQLFAFMLRIVSASTFPAKPNLRRQESLVRRYFVARQSGLR